MQSVGNSSIRLSRWMGLIHESMSMPGDMVKFYNQPSERGIRAFCGFHTCSPTFGKAMSIGA